MPTDITSRDQQVTQGGLAQAFQQLANSPWCILVAMLLANSLARPYSDLIHDARLYAIQVLDYVEPGQYSEDLYLKYGSQDKFSIFSPLIGPLVKRLGIRTAFFSVYLVCNSFLFFAAYQFFFAITKHRLLTALAGIYLAVNAVPFGGLGVFHVNESLLTPRLAAMAFVLLALTQLVKERRWQSLCLLIPAMVIHPLMAFGGVLVWAMCLASRLLTRQQLVIATGLAGLAGLAVLMNEPLGQRLFGSMDATWHTYTQQANSYAAPMKWRLNDWFRIVTAMGIVMAYRTQVPQERCIRDVVDGVLWVGALGVIGGVLAPMLPYALLFQGQPYRSLWLLQTTQLPALAGLVAVAWSASPQRTTTHQCWTILLVSCFAVSTMNFTQLATAAIFVLLYTVRIRAVEPTSKPKRMWAGVGMIACVVLVSLPAWGLVKHVATFPTPMDAVRLLGPLFGPLFMMVVATGLIALLYQRLSNPTRFFTVCLLGMISVQTMFFISPRIGDWFGNSSSHRQNLAQLRSILHQDADTKDRLPTVYWPQGRLDDLWIDLGVTSYFTKHQTAGSMFHRETAIEGHRRAHLVAAFELAELHRRKSFRIDPHDWRVQSRLEVLGQPATFHPPTLSDFQRLYKEDVDFAILPHDFDGLYSHQVGPLYVYDCRQLRKKSRDDHAVRSIGDHPPNFTQSTRTFNSTLKPDIQ